MLINPLSKTGRQLMRSLGLAAGKTAKKVGKKVMYGLKGGDYGKQMGERAKATPEGKKTMEEIEKNPWKSLISAIKSGNKKWFTE